MKIAICDDEQIYIEAIKERICGILSKSLDEELEIYEFNKGNELVEAQKKRGFDVIFLDISMPDLDGRIAAKTLRATSYDLLIAFFSSHDECVFESFDVAPIGFIRKTNIDSDVRQTCQRIIKKYREICIQLTIGEGTEKFEFSPSAIMYFESESRYLNVYYADGKTARIKFSIKKLDKMLEDKGFIRIHKQYLANYRYIFSIEGGEALLIDMKTKLPMTRNRLREIRETYFAWLGGRR